jgi:hypothetical protein
MVQAENGGKIMPDIYVNGGMYAARGLAEMAQIIAQHRRDGGNRRRCPECGALAVEAFAGIINCDNPTCEALNGEHED